MANYLARRKRLFRALKSGCAIALSLYLLVCLALWHYQTRMIFFPDALIKSTPTEVGLTYEDVWLATTNGQVHGWWIPNEFDTRFKTNNKIPVILFFHGNGSNLGDLVSRAQPFHQWGYSTLLIDYRGYGQSSGPFPSEQRVYEDAELSWRYLTEQQQISAARIVIYGHSIGGAIAINLATQHPEAAGLIVEGSFTSMQAMVKYAKSLPLIPVNWLLTQRFDSLDKIKSLRVPLLLIHGTADEVVPPAMSQTLYKAAPLDKTRVLIKGAGHSGLPAVNRELHASTVRGFVAKYAK